MTADGCSGTSLGPKKSCTVTVLYAPAAVGENDGATLTATGEYGSASIALTGHTLHGLIAPNETLATMFVAGTAPRLTTVNYSTSTGRISSTNPGLFLYFGVVTAPALAGLETATVTIAEISPLAPTSFQVLGAPSTTNVKLYDVTGSTVLINGTPVGNSGGASFTISPALEAANGGDTFIVGVEYSTRTIVAQSAPAADPATFTFTTSVNGTLIDFDTTTLDLRPNGG
jgi:hypothetical protein